MTTAIIYQATTPPPHNGLTKPMKPGGYSDSGADIACSLLRQGVRILTPVPDPDIQADLDWVFPDTAEDIRSAVHRGADLIWMNTVLYKGHPVEEYIGRGLSVIGQIPGSLDLYDDKLITNRLLGSHQLPVPRSVAITQDLVIGDIDMTFPAIVKPVRGRGSQGVSLVRHKNELRRVLDHMFRSETYGDTVYIEDFLPGQEITITVMPPGSYIIAGQPVIKENYWSLPAVKRFNHKNEIAPYNGIVAVISNSEVLSDSELNQDKVQEVMKQCEKASGLVNARAPLRIDCRADASGQYFLFDLNMKPNMTGPSRPHRQGQDSLTALAARKIGWSFDDLIINIHGLHWKREDLPGS